MPDRDAHVRVMVGDMVLKIAALQADNDVLLAALTDDALRARLVAQRAAEVAAAAAAVKGSAA